jgi:hypothetical protein
MKSSRSRSSRFRRFRKTVRFIGEQRYEQLLQSQNPPLTKSQFEDSLRRSLALDKLRSALTGWIACLQRRRRERVPAPQ